MLPFVEVEPFSNYNKTSIFRLWNTEVVNEKNSLIDWAKFKFRFLETRYFWRLEITETKTRFKFKKWGEIVSSKAFWENAKRDSFFTTWRFDLSDELSRTHFDTSLPPLFFYPLFPSVSWIWNWYISGVNHNPLTKHCVTNAFWHFIIEVFYTTLIFCYSIDMTTYKGTWKE